MVFNHKISERYRDGLRNNATQSKAGRYSLVHYEVQIESQTIVFNSLRSSIGRAGDCPMDTGSNPVLTTKIGVITRS